MKKGRLSDDLYRKYDSKQCDIAIVRLRIILKSMKTTVHEDNERVFNDCKWYYKSLQNFRRHEDYIEALDIIESLIYVA